MANTFAPNGFQSFGRRDGGSPTAGLTRRFLASTDANTYFRGDPVADSATGPYLTVPSTGTLGIAGIFQGCEYYSAQAGRVLWSNYFPGTITGSTADVISYIIDDPEQLFLVQVSSATAVTSSMISNNIGYTVPTSSLGNTATGYSVATALSTSVGTSSSLAFRIVDFYSNYAPPGVNGTDNTSGGNMIIVAPNNWSRKNLTGV